MGFHKAGGLCPSLPAILTLTVQGPRGGLKVLSGCLTSVGRLFKPLPLSQGHMFGSQDSEVRGGRVSGEVGATAAFCHPSAQARVCRAACGPVKSLEQMKKQVSHDAGRSE